MIEKEDTLSQYPKIKEQLNLLKETVADDIEHLRISEDTDAKVEHKTAGFFIFWIQNSHCYERGTNYYCSYDYDR